MKPHVLIVDADDGASQVTRALVKRITPGASVEIEPTPEGGWQSAQRTPPDVLIIDPSPHGQSGMLLISLCKEDAPATRVIVLTSRPTPTLRAFVKRLGVDVYLEKPTALALLVDRIRGALGGPEAPGPAAFASLPST
jgi:DNA-binding NarL/FixJ family response regulator